MSLSQSKESRRISLRSNARKGEGSSAPVEDNTTQDEVYAMDMAGSAGSSSNTNNHDADRLYGRLKVNSPGLSHREEPGAVDISIHTELAKLSADFASQLQHVQTNYSLHILYLHCLDNSLYMLL